MECTTSGCSAADALAGDTVTYTHKFDQIVSVSTRTNMFDIFKYFLFSLLELGRELFVSVSILQSLNPDFTQSTCNPEKELCVTKQSKWIICMPNGATTMVKWTKTLVGLVKMTISGEVPIDADYIKFSDGINIIYTRISSTHDRKKEIS